MCRLHNSNLHNHVENFYATCTKVLNFFLLCRLHKNFSTCVELLCISTARERGEARRHFAQKYLQIFYIRHFAQTFFHINSRFCAKWQHSAKVKMASCTKLPPHFYLFCLLAWKVNCHFAQTLYLQFDIRQNDEIVILLLIFFFFLFII